MKPHKHAELIKAWADGAEIEYMEFKKRKWNPLYQGWSWDNVLVEKYRIKPTPDLVRYTNALGTTVGTWSIQNESDNLQLTFDGETGKLKSAKVLK